MRAGLFALVMTFLSACTPMPHKPVIGPDFSQYQVTEHRIGCWEMQQRCLPGVPFPIKPLLVAPLGCATVDFERKTCDIYTCAISPGFVLTHEREHCRGMDHGGQIQQAWDAYIQKTQRELRTAGTAAEDSGTRRQ